MPLPIRHPEALAPASRALLATLGPVLHEAELYLAGSGGLALYVGHRTVRDLDLMSMTNRFTPTDRRDLLQALLSTGALVTLVYGVIEAPEAGWLTAQTLGCFAGFALLPTTSLLCPPHSVRCGHVLLGTTGG